jgi:hypothetical protein
MSIDLAQLARERAMRNPAFVKQQQETLEQETRYRKQLSDADEKLVMLEQDLKSLKKELNSALNGCIKDNFKTVQLEQAVKLVKEKNNITYKEIVDQLQKIKRILADIDKPISICRKQLEELSDEFMNLEDTLVHVNRLKVEDKAAKMQRLEKIKADAEALIEALIVKLVAKISDQKRLIDDFFLELYIKLETIFGKYKFNIVEFNQLMNSIKTLYFKQYNEHLAIEEKVEMDTELDKEIAEAIEREEREIYEADLRRRF